MLNFVVRCHEFFDLDSFCRRPILNKVVKKICKTPNMKTMLLDSGMYGKTNFLLQRGLDVAMQRRTVLADNIANADVPHFKRSDISYEAQLRRALDSEKSFNDNFTPARLTDKRHISFYKMPDYQKVKPRVFMDYQSSMRNDGNNVDPEVEVTNALKNQMRYQALMTSLNDQFRTMNLVIRTSA